MTKRPRIRGYKQKTQGINPYILKMERRRLRERPSLEDQLVASQETYPSKHYSMWQETTIEDVGNMLKYLKQVNTYKKSC